MKQEDSMFKLGDLVVGSTDPGKSIYSATGAKISESGVSIYGDEPELDEKRKALVTSAVRSGGSLLRTTNTKKIKSKKKPQKHAISQDDQIVEYIKSLAIQEETSSGPDSASKDYLKDFMKEVITVQFENDFGKIKARLEDLIEHSLAFMLIFKDEDSVVFEPKIGESLMLHTVDSGSHLVYYPGVTFNWPGSSKAIMILFKVPLEQE